MLSVLIEQIDMFGVMMPSVLDEKIMRFDSKSFLQKDLNFSAAQSLEHSKAVTNAAVSCLRSVSSVNHWRPLGMLEMLQPIRF